MIVAQFMEGKRKPCRLGGEFEPLGPFFRVLDSAVVVGKDQVVFLSGPAFGLDRDVLPFLVQPDLLHRHFRQGQHPPAGVGFGIVKFQSLVGDNGGPLDTDGVGAEIKVYPL